MEFVKKTRRKVILVLNLKNPQFFQVWFWTLFELKDLTVHYHSDVCHVMANVLCELKKQATKRKCDIEFFDTLHWPALRSKEHI